MHEWGIVRDLLARSEQVCREHGARSVRSLHLQIGERSGVEVELLRRAFEVFREPTLCAGAALEVESVACQWGCRMCHTPGSSSGTVDCSLCGAPLTLLAGTEILLTRLELEVDDV